MAGRRRGKIFTILVGCVSLVLFGVGVTGAMVVWAGLSYRSLGEPTARQAAMTIAAGDQRLPAPLRPEATDTPPQGADLVALDSLELAAQEPSSLPTARLDIELAEGQFEIVPGEPGSDVTVSGTIADAYYELEETRAEGSDGADIAIRLKPKAGFFTRMLAGLNHFDHDHPNKLTVSIPPDVPFALNLALEAGESKVQLGGLHLTALKADLSKGSHRLSFAAPNTGAMEHLELNLGMGEGRVHGLGHAHAASTRVETGMGEFSVALDGDWQPGSEVDMDISHSMGDLTVRVPREVRISQASSSTIMMGGLSGSLKKGNDDLPEDAPVLNLKVHGSMGGVNIRRQR